MPFQAWVMNGVLDDLLSHVSGVILQTLELYNGLVADLCLLSPCLRACTGQRRRRGPGMRRT